MAGLVGRSSDGKIYRQSDGKVLRATGTDPCCCAVCCAGGVPDTITVTFSGISSTCVDTGSGTDVVNITSGSPNGTFDLPKYSQGATECCWEESFSGVTTASTYFFSATCTGTPSSEATYFHIVVRVTSSGSLTVRSFYRTYEATDCGAGAYAVEGFNSSDTLSTPVQCADMAATFNNDNTSAVAGSPAYGGTATISF